MLKNAVAIYESLDDIPEELRSQAKEVDGKFQLPVEGLTTKVNELIGSNKKYKGVYDKFSNLGENIDGKTVQQALQDMKDADKREQEVLKRIEQAVAENNRTHERTIQEANTARDRMKAALERQIIDNELIKEITAAEGDAFFVTPQLRGSLKTFEENGEYVAKVVDKDGKPRLSAKTGQPMTIAELVGEAKADKKFAAVFKAPAASGAGTQSAGGGGTNTNGVVKLSATDAKDPVKYREAMKLAGDDATRIQIVQEAS